MPKPKRYEWRIKQKIPQKASSSAPPPPPRWVDLPREITADILRRVGVVDTLLNAQNVCTTWWEVCHDSSMWRVIDMRNAEDVEMDGVFHKACRVAVDRSQGQLSKINIEYFGNDYLLKYIAERSNQLRHLRLVGCDTISKGCLAAVAENFPLLEELHIYLSAINIVDIEAFGRSCSQLKSFTLNACGFRGGLTGFSRLQINVNDQAHAIAVNMPELRHLALFGNTMTNEGLCAILDGCPRLESLDLRHCYSIDLEGDLETRCRQQIVDLKCPHDCTHGYEFSAQICDYNPTDDESDLDLSDYYDYDDYHDFEYDDFNNPFGGEYLLDEDGFFW
ncbi:putative F-box/LRR-repeat protein 23 [Solanum dulcamara]|uniref:putative F-box/LRR-repeat protein 23 n=1 Tax=Solanum dulcamara TaxID=45834 RepID=UPI0024852887|nr:putative F-box/LRR-repeat protein 23 [Solanum dulcamara]XP_055805545.1 putative F-box/LRR-repeat protein 23 [Solanum dulcamara]